MVFTQSLSDAWSAGGRRCAGLGCLILLLSAVSCATPTSPTGASTANGAAQDGSWLERQSGAVSFRYAEADTELMASIVSHVDAEGARVSDFLRMPFPRPFQVVVWPDRQQYVDRFRSLFLQTPPCGAIGFAQGFGIELLPPRLWTCNPPNSPDDLRIALAHELTHVLHLQQPGFAYGSDLSWFVEGLAVHVSGQLDHDWPGVAQARLASGYVPASLATLMSADAGYALSGDLVRFIDRTWGRTVLSSLTRMSSTPAILSALNETEAGLVARWRRQGFNSERSAFPNW